MLDLLDSKACLVTLVSELAMCMQMKVRSDLQDHIHLYITRRQCVVTVQLSKLLCI